MSEASPKPGYLSYIRGESLDLLNEAHSFNEEETTFRNNLQFYINTYAQQHDHAGPRAAEFVEALPSSPENPLQQALLGLLILQETNEALRELLEADADFKRSLNNDDDFSPELDGQVKRDAREFDKRHGNDKKQTIVNQVLQEEEIEAREVCDSAYQGNSYQIEKDVNSSMRDKLDGEGEMQLPVSSTSAHKETDYSPETSAPEEQEELITIKVPDYAGQPPTVAFRQSLRWLGKHLIAVATGTMREDSFPRIRPLIDLEVTPKDEVCTISKDKLPSIISDIRRQLDALKPPMGETGGEMNAFFDNVDPKLGGKLRDLLDSISDQFGVKKVEPWESGGGSWKD